MNSLKFIFLLFFLTATSAAFSQIQLDVIDEKERTRQHLMYLASDELRGRRPGTPGCEAAASYIAEQFRRNGVQPAAGEGGFLQTIPFERVTPPSDGALQLGESVFSQGDNLLILNGKALDATAEAIFAGNGWVDAAAGVDDYAGKDVRGKIVFVLPGKPGNKDIFSAFDAVAEKRRLAAERGAAALIELYRGNLPWNFFKKYFSAPRTEIAQGGADDPVGKMVYGWLKEGVPNPISKLEGGETMQQASLKTGGVHSEKLSSANVVGIIPGSDPKLKEEYLVLSAHYDHVGVGKEGGMPYKEDSIFNGARDNAIGVVALLYAAGQLAHNPPKRSVLLLACTAEEMGLLGSKWYADHPLIPLKSTVFNLNTDGAGYNSTQHISIIGWEQTNVNSLIEKAAVAYGLEIVKDPEPEQNLYERSDNFSFAEKGVPAIDFSPGLTAMDETILKYYHQAADNPDTVDPDYLLVFCKAFAQTARLIGDMEGVPAWREGSKFEKLR